MNQFTSIQEIHVNDTVEYIFKDNVGNVIGQLSSEWEREPQIVDKWIHKNYGLICPDCGGWINDEISTMLESRKQLSFCPYCGKENVYKGVDLWTKKPCIKAK